MADPLPHHHEQTLIVPMSLFISQNSKSQKEVFDYTSLSHMSKLYFQETREIISKFFHFLKMEAKSYLFLR
jgi:hypothetical protein